MPTINRKIEAYLEQLVSVRRVMPETQRLYRHYLTRFQAFLEERGAAPDGVVTPQRVSAFLAWLGQQHELRTGRPLSPWAQDKAYDTLRGFFRWGCDLGHFRKNPFCVLRPPIIRAERRPIARREAIVRLLELVGRPGTPLARRDAALYGTLYFAGARIAETCRLQLHDLDLERGFISFREAKGGTWRDVPVHHELRQLLRAWLRARAQLLEQLDARSDYVFVAMPGHGAPRLGLTAGHVDGARMSKLLKTRYLPAARDHGLAGAIPARFTNHCFRHSFLTRLLERGVPIDRAGEIVGHKDPKTTKIYSHYRPGRFRADVNRA